MYTYVLQTLKVDPKDCIMIGDSRYSDVIMAEKAGITGLLYFPWLHKIHTNISRKLDWKYSHSIMRKQASFLYKNTCFYEYALILYYFAVQLIEMAEKDYNHNLAFLSRGGYFLKKVTDIYLRLSGNFNIKTCYCYNSRRVCLNAKESATHREILRKYLSSFIEHNKFVLIDEGWYCHSQQLMTTLLDLNTIGYYLGTRGKDKISGNHICSRKGILFDIHEDGSYSSFYGIFCTNCSMYEEMLTSPEGSVISYLLYRDSSVVPELKVNEVEQKLYKNIISDWQKHMALIIKGLCVWNLDRKIDRRLLAKMILKSSLFANSERCKILNILDSSMIDNCKGKVQKAKNYADVHVDYIDLIRHPDMYLGQICKLQRHIYKNLILNTLYKIIAIVYYVYVRLLKRI